VKDREINLDLVRPAFGDTVEAKHAAALTCAAAAARGVFPPEELPDCLRMLGLLT